MTRQTAAPIEHINLTATYRSVRDLVRMRDDGLLTADPPYQRQSVWTTGDQVDLVRSWLRGATIPSVILNDRDTPQWKDANGPLHGPCYAVIDGKQRIEAGAAWLGGQLAVPASWFTAEDVTRAEETGDGRYVRYTGLSRPARTQFAMTAGMLPVATAKVATVADEAGLYLLVNRAGIAQTPADLQRAARIARDR